MHGDKTDQTDPIIAMHEISIQHALVEYVNEHPDHFPEDWVEVFSRYVAEPIPLWDLVVSPWG